MSSDSRYPVSNNDALMGVPVQPTPDDKANKVLSKLNSMDSLMLNQLRSVTEAQASAQGYGLTNPQWSYEVLGEAEVALT
ncbi:MAG: hypothetical protein LBH03_00475, partial [Holophagales bacterium]|nr:hypothetical protein [Holophagales bacterium]